MNDTGTIRSFLHPDGKGSATFSTDTLGELPHGFLRCQTIYSLISPGTEKMQITAAKGKSIKTILKEGVRLGYCATARVIESKVQEIDTGSIVACYGAPYVCHGSIMDVPRLLAVKLSGDEMLRCGAFAGLGTIALHGFRLARAGLGDRVLVLGAGIIGNFCAQLARFAGCRVTVTDPVQERLDLLHHSMSPMDRHQLVKHPAEQFPEKFDAVCVTAGSLNDQDWRFVFGSIRRGARVVMMGGGEMNLPRDLLFETEADVVVSRAGGPGRYDPDYEAEGRNYPPQFVRWPEGENLREIVSLLEANLLKAAPLLDDIIPVGEYTRAYRQLLDMKPRPALLLDWTKFEDGDTKS